MGVEMRILKPLGQVREPADGAQPSHRRRVRAPQPRERRRGHALLRTLSAAHGGLAVTTPHRAPEDTSSLIQKWSTKWETLQILGNQKLLL